MLSRVCVDVFSISDTKTSRRVADVLLDCIWQFIAPWYTLHHNVLVLDPRSSQCLLRAVKKCINNLSVPARVDDANPQFRT